MVNLQGEVYMKTIDLNHILETESRFPDKLFFRLEVVPGDSHPAETEKERTFADVYKIIRLNDLFWSNELTVERINATFSWNNAWKVVKGVFDYLYENPQCDIQEVYDYIDEQTELRYYLNKEGNRVYKLLVGSLKKEILRYPPYFHSIDKM